MARIPQRTFVSPRDSEAQIPQGVFNSSIRATTELISSLGGVADFIAKEGAKAQEIANASQKRQKLREFREAKAQFDNDMAGDPDNGIPAVDPSQHTQKWGERLKSIEANALSGDMAPEVKRFVQENYKEFSSRTTIDITGRAFKENRRIAKGTYLRDMQDDLDNGFYDSARNILDEAKALNIVDDLEYKDLIKKFYDREKDDMLTRSMLGNPDKFIGYLKEGKVEHYNLSPHEQRAWEQKTKREKIKQENEAVQVINEMVELNEIDSLESLEKELADTPQISDKRKNLVIKNYESTKPIPNKIRYGLKDKLIKALSDFKQGNIDFNQYKKAYDEIATEVGTFGKRPAGHLKTYLYNYDPIKFSASGNETEARKKANAYKDMFAMGYKSVAIRSASIASQDLKEKGVSEGDDGYIQAKQEAELLELEFKKTLEKEVDQYIDGLSHEAKHDANFVVKLNKFIDSIQAKVKVQVMAERQKPYLPSKPSRAEEARGYLGLPVDRGVTPNSTLLPKQER